MDTYRSTNKYIMLAVAVIFVYLSPLYIMGQDAHVLILDNVDGAVASLKVLAESGQIFGSMHSTVSAVMNGLPRNTFSTEFNLQVFLYWALPAFTAYVLNLTLVHLIAFLGMFLLLKRYVLPEKRNEAMAVGIALAFALLPFWPFGGLSVAGQPLVLYAFMNIRSKMDNKMDWIILALVPFYSSLVFSFAFFLFMMGLWWIYDVIFMGKVNTRFLVAIFFMGLVFLLVEYRLIYNTFFDSGFISIRSEFPLSRIPGKRAALNSSIANFFYGQYHAASLQSMVIIPSVALALLIAGIKRRIPGILLGLLLITGIISIWYGFWFFDGWIPIKQQFGFLREFNFSRFHWLHPLLWYLIFALALKIIAGNNRLGKALVMILIVVQIGFLFSNNDEIVERKAGRPSYKAFYAEDLFRDVKEYIGQDQKDYRVVSIGIHPSISQYNGFYTLDGYSSNYPLAYKHEFRKIIAEELDKSPFYRDYFDALGGSRCYIFVEKLFYNSMMEKDAGIKIEKLDLDTGQLKKMGGKYVFSALEILDSNDNKLKLLKVFENNNSAWKIYLYEVL
ncbi:MAG: hypothetical protein CVU90_06910 [Firmicutes bacterium HGW-Firmicutes-15]|nr:MAG: hypothetical protein CVU90_06910 [Firmicutes bacterium HGW-Firmicutes-15]